MLNDGWLRVGDQEALLCGFCLTPILVTMLVPGCIGANVAIILLDLISNRERREAIKVYTNLAFQISVVKICCVYK